jgi:hypothetical protein
MPDNGDDGTAPNDPGPYAAPSPPDNLQGHESVWNMANAAMLSGAEVDERDEIARAHYEGYVNPAYPTGSPDREAWRDYADILREEYDLDMDWVAWRAEMGYT